MRWVAAIVAFLMAAVAAVAQTPAGQKPQFDLDAIEWNTIAEAHVRQLVHPEEIRVETPTEQVTPSFDVATVKRSRPETVTRHFTIQRRRFVTSHTSLADLIQYAYGLHPRQILKGPKWLESDKFDVVGAFSIEPTTEQELMKMMAGLLASRFQLRFHFEKRELAVYAIVLARDGAKLKLSDGDPNGVGGFAFRGRGQLIATNANVGDLAWELQSAVVDRPVVDHTGLTSRFTFTLTGRRMSSRNLT